MATDLLNADTVRQEELARLDKMYAGLEGKIEGGDLPAIRVGLAIMERRARYLGLDAPTSHQHQHHALLAVYDLTEQRLAVEEARQLGLPVPPRLLARVSGEPPIFKQDGIVEQSVASVELPREAEFKDGLPVRPEIGSGEMGLE